MKFAKYVVVYILLVVVGAYLVLISNPLPSDESMIANFKEHRAEFDELVRRYREYESPPGKHYLWKTVGDTPGLAAKAGIYYINDVTPLWLANPYSIKTGRAIHEGLVSGKGIGLSFKYGALILKPAPKSDYYATSIRHLAVIWKDYYFIPEVPLVEDDLLLFPVGQRGEYLAKKRSLPSLNSYPENWKPFECVYRQIEPHWFLHMCNGH